MTKQIDKEFDEKINIEAGDKLSEVIGEYCPTCGTPTNRKKLAKEIKSFYNSKISELLEEIVGEEDKKEKTSLTREFERIIKNDKRQEIIDIIKKKGFKI